MLFLISLKIVLVYVSRINERFFHKILNLKLINFSHCKSESAITLLTIEINIFLYRLNFWLILGRRSQWNKLFICSFSKNEDFIVWFSIDDDTHHFSFRGKFIDFEDFIFFCIAIDLNFNFFCISGNNIDYSRH